MKKVAFILVVLCFSLFSVSSFALTFGIKNGPDVDDWESTSDLSYRGSCPGVSNCSMYGAYLPCNTAYGVYGDIYSTISLLYSTDYTTNNGSNWNDNDNEGKNGNTYWGWTNWGSSTNLRNEYTWQIIYQYYPGGTAYRVRYVCLYAV